MTKEQTIDRIKVMQAYVAGKRIQIYDAGTRRWRDIINDPLWDSVAKYRIKPEKHVRPYTFEEMCTAVKKHGTLVLSKDGREVWNIQSFDGDNVLFNVEVLECYEIFLERNMWFDDNSPCGIEEE